MDNDMTHDYSQNWTLFLDHQLKISGAKHQNYRRDKFLIFVFVTLYTTLAVSVLSYPNSSIFTGMGGTSRYKGIESLRKYTRRLQFGCHHSPRSLQATRCVSGWWKNHHCKYEYIRLGMPCQLQDQQRLWYICIRTAKSARDWICFAWICGICRLCQASCFLDTIQGLIWM